MSDSTALPPPAAPADAPTTPKQHLFDDLSLAILERNRAQIPALCGEWMTPGPRKDPAQVDEYETDPELRCAGCREAVGLPT